MKKLLAIALLALGLSSPAFAGNLIVGAGIARETVTEPVDVEVDLYQVKGVYRFDNAVTAGAVFQAADPDLGPSERRYEVTAGYNPKVGNASVNVEVGYGLRNSDVMTDVDYYYVTVGASHPLGNNFVGDLQYRYRDSNELDKWRTDLYTVGLGYKVNPTTLVRGSYGQQYGDFESNIVALTVVKVF